MEAGEPGGSILIVVAAGLLGLVVGSFLNVVIHRVPLRRSVVWPASRCPDCGEPIRPRDNLPVLSYLLLRGRCRSCKALISARYPLVEALTGVLFAAAAYEFGLGVELLSALVLISERWWVYPISALAVAGGLLALALAYPGGMGMGDVKMGGMLGAFLGPYAALAVFLGAFAGAMTGGFLIATGRIRRRHALPFGVFMALGGIVALFVGPQLWELYLDLVGAGF
jgi:leader peptidase (prepilin peptidase) / N-methyltransferase